MKKIFSVIVLCLVLSPMACSSLGLFKGDDGKIHTKAGDTVAMVGKAMQEVGGVVPGYGTVLSMIGGLVIMAGGLVTTTKKWLDEKNISTAIITGVEESNPQANVAEVKKVIAKVAVNHKVADKVRTRVAQVTGDPKTGV